MYLAGIQIRAFPFRPASRLLLTVLGASVALVFLYAAGIRSAFEWDEVLFARAVGNFDAAANSPHMPGYPVFVFATRIVALGVHDAVRAVQNTSLIAAVLAVVLVFFSAKKLGLNHPQALAAAAVLALCPCFLWFAGVGLSDAAGVLSSCAVLWAILQREKPVRWAVLTGVLAATAVGVRSQAIYLLVPMGAIAVIEWRGRTLLRVLSAAGAAIVTSLGIWIPAIIVTGPSRWWEAFVWQLKWVRQEQMSGLALPFAPIWWIVQGWLIRPFGTPWLAAPFWILVFSGAGILWHAGKRRLVLYCLGLGLVSLLLAAASLDLRNGPRYILPSLLFFSFLIAGGIGRTHWYEKLMTGATALFMIGSVVWILPGLTLRRSEPAPVMSILEQIGASIAAKDAVVFYEEKLWPHTNWMLERRGFEIHPMGELESWSRAHQEESRSIVTVYSNRRPKPEEASFRAAWDSPQVRAMTPGRYLRCWAVERRPGN